MDSIIQHPDLGVAQAVKQILTKEMAARGLIANLGRRFVSLWTPEQIEDFSFLALSRVRNQEDNILSRDTSKAISQLRSVEGLNGQSEEAVAAMRSTLVRAAPSLNMLKIGQDIKVVRPYALVDSSEIFDGDEAIAAIVETFNDGIEKHPSFRHMRKQVKDGKHTQGLHTYTGIGLSIDFHGRIPTILISIIRNTELKNFSIVDDLVKSLNGLFGGRLSFRTAIERWNEAKASIWNSTDLPNGWGNYFKRGHKTLRPGLSIQVSTGVEGSMALTASTTQMSRLFPDIPIDPQIDGQNFLISARHVLFSPDADVDAPVVKRLGANGTPVEIGAVRQPSDSLPWYLQTDKYMFDVGLAKIEHGYWEIENLISHTKMTDFAIRLPAESELAKVSGYSGPAILLGASGPVKAQLTELDADKPYIYRTKEKGPVYLSSSGARVAKSLDTNAGKEGNSGGPVVVDFSNGNGGLADNVAIGIRIAGNKGAANFTDIDDRRAPRCIYLPIAALSEDWARINISFSENTDNRDEAGPLENATSTRKLSDAEAVDKRSKSKDQKLLSKYYDLLMKEESNIIDQKLMAQIKKELRAIGGLIVSTSIKKNPDTGEVRIEFELANKSLTPEHMAFGEKYREYADIEMFADIGIPRANSRH